MIMAACNIRYIPLPLDRLWQVVGLLRANFEQLPWKPSESSWPEANLDECMVYLRRSMLLDIPQEWKKLIPSTLGELDQLRGQ